MKLRKATIYFYDANEAMEENLKDELQNVIDYGTDISVKFFEVEEVEIGEWHDDIDINFTDCKKETFEKYFKKGENND